jgi:ZIP family zinc transporter
MTEALVWGLVASSSLLIGSLVGLRFTVSRRHLGMIMAFAAGVLISALSYELFVSARETHRIGAGVGLFAGSLAFFAGDTRLERRGGQGRKSSEAPEAGGAPMAIVLGTVLDGVPESVVLGLTLVEGSVSLTMLVAVFLSNFPEALAATAGLRKRGWASRPVLALWAAVACVSGVASALGYGALSDASPFLIASVLGFAAGAILTMLADTMVPEAFQQSGELAGVVTTFGFAVAVLVQALE